MAYRLFANKLAALGLGVSLIISGCEPTGSPGTPGANTARPSQTADEIELQRRSKALQKTVLEGAAAGAAAGAAISVATNSENFRRDVLIGAALGAVAGSYVASLQNSFASREQQLEKARADIRATNDETRATLEVMRAVQRREIAEIRSLRAAVAEGRTNSAALNARLRAARENLSDMNGAIQGAEGRAKEFSRARAVFAAQEGQGNIDRELTQLQERIRQMRAVAEELSNNI